MRSKIKKQTHCVKNKNNEPRLQQKQMFQSEEGCALNKAGQHS